MKHLDIDNMIRDIRGNVSFYQERFLKGPSIFEQGYCYEFALSLFNSLKQDKKAKLIFLMGGMKKCEAKWYKTEDFDPSVEHPFHALIKVGRSYYDINGKLGSKRNVLASWSYFRNKKVVEVSAEDVQKHIRSNDLVDALMGIM